MEAKGVSTRKNLDFNLCKIAMSDFMVEILVVSVVVTFDWVNFIIFRILVMLAVAIFVFNKELKHRDFPIVARDMLVRLRLVRLLQLAECESFLQHGFEVLHKIEGTLVLGWKFYIQWLEGSMFQEDSFQ